MRVEPNSVITAGPAPVGVARLFEAGTAGSIEITGKVKLDVPACALKEDTVISIEHVPSAVENTIRNTEFKTLAGNVYEMLPRGLVFDCGVQLGINYDPQQLTQEGLTLGSLVMLQSQDGRLVRRARAEPILASNQLHATISHFTFYFLGYISNSNVGGMQVYGDTVFIAPGPAMLNDGSVWKNKAQTYQRTGNTMNLIAEDYQTDCPAGVVWCIVSEQASNGKYLFVSYIYFDGLLETQDNRSWKVDIFDISIVGSPGNPVYLKSLDATSGIASPERIKVFGDFLVLSDSQGISLGSPTLLQIINVADINSPSIVTIPLEDVIHDFTVSGNIIYSLQRSFSDATDVRVGARNLMTGAFLGNLVSDAPYDTASFAILGQKMYMREWDGPVTIHTFSGTTITATQQSQIIPGYVNLVPTANVLYTGSAADPARIMALDPVSFSQIGSHVFSFPAQNAYWQLADLGNGYIVANAFAATMQNQSSALELIRFEFPVLAAIQPAEGSAYLPVNTPIVFDFNNPMDAVTLVAPTNTDCAGATIQVSADDFSSCATMTSANPVMSNGGRTATFMPVGLLPDKTYKVRLIGNVLDSGGAPAAAFTQTSGWNTLVRPQVISVLPADGALNVSINTSITVNFSWAMEPATLTATTTTACAGSVQVSVDNFVTCVPMTSTAGVMSNGGQTVTFTPTGLSIGLTYKVRMTTSISGANGVFLATQYDQVAGFVTRPLQWMQKGSELNLNIANPYSAYPSIAVSPVAPNYPHVTWYEGNVGIHVKYWDGANWIQLGGNLGNGTYPKIAFAANGTPYVVWYQNGVFVKHWNGSSWVADGGNVNIFPANQAYNVSIAFDGNVPYVVWQENTSAGLIGQIFVKYFNGSAWVQLGAGSLNVNTGGEGAFPKIAVVAGIPYVTWGERNYSAGYAYVYVKHWNGNNWVQDGSILNVDPQAGAMYPDISYAGTTPYITWNESRYLAGNLISKIFVKHFDSTNWVQDGSNVNLNTAVPAVMPMIAFTGSNAFVVWNENNPWQIFGKTLSSGTWEQYGGNLSLNVSHNASLGGVAMKGTVPYVVWMEHFGSADYRILVKAYE